MSIPDDVKNIFSGACGSALLISIVAIFVLWILSTFIFPRETYTQTSKCPFSKTKNANYQKLY